MADEGAVRVCVRVRPLIERENTEAGDKETVVWKSEKFSISQVDGTKFFTFDRVFHAEESTSTVYKEVADPIIKSAVQGYNGTIFAYGQTASGKTYTMLGTESSPGILPMAIEDVFKTICSIPDREFLLRISYMEIHNETIKDLLCSNITKKKPLIIREDISRTIYVEDLIEEVVVSPEEVMRWLQKGEKSRHYGETKMNARSSRSHTIFRMIIESKERDSSSSNCDGAVMVSHLNLVDLAGSERASQTGTDGIRFKEGCNINRSLLTLGQVIKKLCDDQSGGFINYRDSKLTRILQNSLGGNAKTVIICTVTPVSLEETLSTLQFASTAKKMKNSPKVNEVLDDDALLKRYRREIEDLKRRLEEVSSGCHTRDEEKDQLAQLLEEKNSLQKQQEDRIRTLAKLVVPSSSFLQEEELKARKRRRVTWAPGQISHNRDLFSEDFPEKPKRFKVSMSALSEMEESAISDISECDDPCLAISAAVPEEEWIPGPEMSLIHKDFADSVILCETLAAERDCAVTKQEATLAELETLQLEKEQLSQEVKELTEKIETNEFIVLEKKTAEEHEMQLMHEISNLKAVIANAEGYNQDLQDDLQSKELQLKEAENKIALLEKQIIQLRDLLEESQKTSSRNADASLTGTSQVTDEMKQSLNDAEIVALDAKKEAAFLRSENLQLKERNDQLLDDYDRMGKDVERYRSQVEAGKAMYKKMQSDLQKELQYYFQENAKLTSLLEGTQSSVELNEKIIHLKNELNKALGENVSLREEVAALSEAGLKPDLEILHKEILEKSQSIASLTSGKETLLSQVAEKEQRILEMTAALKSKEDVANAEAVRKNDELGQELATVCEENKRLQGQIESLSGENLKLHASVSEMVQEGLVLQEQLNNADGSLKEYHDMVEKLRCQNSLALKVEEELNQTIEQLKQKAVDTQAEVEKLLEKTKSQEQQVIQQESLIVEQEEQFRKREAELGEEITQLKDKLEQLTEELNLEMAENNRLLAERKAEAERMQQLGTQNSLLQKERDDIQQAMEEVKAENDQLGDRLRENTEKVEQLAEKLSLQMTENNHLLNERKAEAESMQKLGTQNSLLQKGRDDLQQAMEEVKAENDQLRGRLRENTEKGLELREQLNNTNGSLEENNDTVELRREHSQVLKTQEGLSQTILQLKQEVVETQAEVEKLLEKTRSQEQLVIQQDNLIVEREGHLRKPEAELGEEITQLKEKVEQLAEKLSLQITEDNHLLDERKAEAASMQQLGMQNSLLQKERDDLQQAMEEVKAENDQLRGRLRENTEKVVEIQAEVEKLLEKTRSQEQLVIQQESLIVEQEGQLRKQEAELGEEMTQLKEKVEQLTERLSLQIAEANHLLDERKAEAASMQQLGMQNSLLQKERDDLQQAMEEVKAENDQLRGRLRENTEKGLVLQEQLNSADGSLKEYHDMVEKLRCQNSLALKTEEELNQTIEKLKQKVVDTQAEVEKLLEKTRTQEQLVIQQETLIVEREEQLRKREAELGEEMTQLKEKVVDTQAEMMKLLEKTRFQEQQATRQESLIVDREQQLRKREAELGEEITQWKEKVEQLTERLSFQMAENNHLLDERKAKVESTQQLGMQNSLLQKESDDIQQAMEEVKAENDQLRGRLRENTEKGLELQEQLNSADGSLKEYHDMVEKLRCQNSLALKTEEELNQTIEQLKQKVVDTQAEVEKLLEKTRSQEQQVIQQENLIVSQEEQLRKREAELGEEMAQLKEKFSKTNAELQKDLHELREQLAKATEEKTPEDKEREDLEILQAKVSKIEEALQKFPAIEQRYEYLGRVAWNLMTEVNSEKELVTKVLKDVSHEKAKQIRRLQMEHEIVSNGLQKLLNKTQFLSLRLCKREKEYYSSISSYTMELLGERRKQHELLTQIQSLKEPCRNSHAAVSQQLYLPELSQNLDFHVEQIWKDVSQMEEEICSIEAMLQKLENEGRKMERHSVPFDVQDFETTVKRDNERLFPVGQFLKPKPRPLIEAKEELESKNKNYCKETEASLKACRERTRELHLALNMAKEQQTPSGHADLILEDENCRLESKLRAQDQAMKDLKLTIQGLEKAANEAKQNLLEKERRIAVLEMELKVRASRSEVVRLRAVLEEKENVLTNTLTENQTLKAQLNEGAELYKEEIEDLKTQLAKADMTLIKQSKRFDWQLANAKALLEQRDEQLRRTREELRRTQLEQDTTVVHSQNVPQPPLPITCGGGSGIVQNTQMLVLQAEHAKLEREVGRLKKEHELLLKNELHLKEEVRKWKERALKMRERSRATSEEEQRLKSPRKTAPPLLTGPSSSPSKESSVQPPPALDKRPSSLNYPKTFFDNSCLGTFSDVRLTGGESKERTKPENSLKDWMEKANKEGKPECKTQ
ncbi:centromere-associated protein E isoform X4 [Sphaerodactylus townsendi]|uniref:centromere-associated protein E isoform X4 n=1 Tax=Sphaerodactylus townsendi TaxID=933632 RepID=UPI0020266A76|nr:centromere-associated protein E isoform X4 [Sphaerodactylus townsendi]